MVSLKDKVVLITGASGGIGTETCRLIAEQGAKFVLGSNDAAALNELESSLKAKGCQAVSMVLDVTVEEQVKAFVDLAVSSFGGVDILLNFAGLSIPAQITEMEESKYDITMDVNVKGTFLACKHFVPHVNTEKGALILNIASMASKKANPNAPMYCTAKAAVAMLSAGLALQVKDKNIRVTTLNPGAVNSAFWGDRKVPREKFMIPTDVAEVILFILTRESRVVFHDVAFESFLNF